MSNGSDPAPQTFTPGLFSLFSRRMFRRSYTSVGPSYSTAVLNCLKVMLGFRERGKGRGEEVEIVVGTSRLCFGGDFAFPFKCCSRVPQNNVCPLRGKLLPLCVTPSDVWEERSPLHHLLVSRFPRLCNRGKALSAAARSPRRSLLACCFSTEPGPLVL